MILTTTNNAVCGIAAHTREITFFFLSRLFFFFFPAPAVSAPSSSSSCPFLESTTTLSMLPSISVVTRSISSIGAGFAAAAAFAFGFAAAAAAFSLLAGGDAFSVAAFLLGRAERISGKKSSRGPSTALSGSVAFWPPFLGRGEAFCAFLVCSSLPDEGAGAGTARDAALLQEPALALALDAALPEALAGDDFFGAAGSPGKCWPSLSSSSLKFFGFSGSTGSAAAAFSAAAAARGLPLPSSSGPRRRWILSIT